MKKLVFITQSKGGAGKSVLTFLLAEKYKEAIILDMDDATKTTTLQLAYRKPIPVAFLNANNTIDRGIFSTFLEKLSTKQSELFLADLGASISEQLPFYFHEVSDVLPSVLTDLGIELKILNVVGGANIFTQTMAYLDSLVKSVNGQFRIKIYKNDYYDCTAEQNQTLERYAATYHLEVIPFTISKDRNESTQNRIKEVLKSGEGIDKASVFSKMYFQHAIKSIEI